MVGLPWTAYAVSQAFYYRKAMKENTKDGIKYDTVMEELKQELGQEQQCFEADFNSYYSDIEPIDHSQMM